jgi:hypothetical protein
MGQQGVQEAGDTRGQGGQAEEMGKGDRPRDNGSVARALHVASQDQDQSPQPGETWLLFVPPPPWYAGTVGTRAVIDSVSADSTYVLFECGMRECFPRARFADYFRSAPVSGGEGVDPGRFRSWAG